MKKTLILIVFSICSIIQIYSLHQQQKIPNIGYQKIFIKDSYNYFTSKNQNKVWAGALSLAWQQLNEDIIKQKVQIQSSDKVVNKIVQNFNTCPFNKNDLLQSSYYIKSGFGQQTVNKINKEVKQKFPEKTTPDLDVQLSKQDIISYAYLFKKFQYPVKFQSISNFKFKNQSIKGFRASSQAQKDQVKYFYYQSQKQFLIKVITKIQNQGVYFLRTKDSQNQIKQIIQQVTKWQKSPAFSLTQIDSFSMPVIDLDYFRTIHQLQNKDIKNKGFEIYSFSKVFQALKLKVDQIGVKVQNEGGIIITKSFMPIGNPKQFILNDTFWIVLKQTGKHPYLFFNGQTKNNQELGNLNSYYKDNYNYFQTKNNNKVWAGALTLAWKQINYQILNQYFIANTNNMLINKIVQNFNQSPLDISQISNESYYIKAGFGPQTIRKINKQVKQKFPQKTFPDLVAFIPQNGIVTYAYLFKKFQYSFKFQYFSDFKFKNIQVPGFKAKTREQFRQIKYFYYKNNKQFLIKIDTKSFNEQFYLLRTNKQYPMKQIINTVMRWQLLGKPIQLSMRDNFSMPIIDLEYSRILYQLSYLGLKNQGFQDHNIGQAFENIKLKIDENGVKAQNQGAIMKGNTFRRIIGRPKQFILNDTFWIILKQTRKHPYFCIKINSPTDKEQIKE